MTLLLCVVIALKVGNKDAAGGAAPCADREVGTFVTFVIVYDRDVVDDLDRAERADLFALFAADAARGADLARDGALILAAARDDDALHVSDK